MRNATGLVGQPEGVKKPRFRRRHAVAIFVAANLSSFPAGVTGDGAFYTSFQLPSIAPPAWLFAPMWLFLNVTSLIALSQVANAPQLTRRHRLFFVLEGTGWLLFALFNMLYFGLKSPTLGTVDTTAGLVIGTASLACCLALDRRAAWLIVPRVLWLLLATYVSVCVALNNPDLLFGAA